MDIFHLAIPCRNLEEAKCFYVDQLGCALHRQYEDRITLKFFEHQVVCHLNPEKTDKEAQLYPRHFGITFETKEKWDTFLDLITKKQISFLKAPFSRFTKRPEEHLTFFLKDPSNNVLEFKYYYLPEMRY